MILKNATLSLLLSEPNCSPIDNQGVKWQQCYFEKNQWYGITDIAMTYEEAVQTCNKAGGELASITSSSIDQCAFTAMKTAEVNEELVLFSGRYFDLVSDWFWCPRLVPGVSEQDACNRIKT